MLSASSSVLLILSLGVAAGFSPVAPSLRTASGPNHGLQLRGNGVPVARASQRTTVLMAAPKIIISGAPASGKGTQCEFIVNKFGVVHISTGDALREQVKEGTELGKLAQGFMEKGALVPDEVMIGIVRDRLAADDCKSNGWLLDGFPRTGVQAEAMAKEGIEADKFILLNVPDDVLIERCVGRRSDPETGKIYHLKFNPPPEDPEVQARLVHRADDTEEAMGSRIKMYNANVDAVKGYYKPITQEFDGVGDKMELADKIAAFVGKAPSKLVPVEWDAPSAGGNVTIGGGGGVAVEGSGTVVSSRGFGDGEDFEVEFQVSETGRGSWVGLVRGGEGGGGLPDLDLSLSAIGWGVWGGETGAIHPTYVKGRVGDQVPGFRKGMRVGLRMRGGELAYSLDGEELCVVWGAGELGGGGGGEWYVAASNGWAGRTAVCGNWVEGLE